MAEVSIIIPVRDRLRPTRRCLESVRRHTAGSYEVIVLDNASGPATRRYLGELRRRRLIRLRRNRVNESFAAAVNQGMSLARGEVLVWLNNDAEVSAGWLERLRRALEREPRAGAAGPCSDKDLRGAVPPPDRRGAFACAWAMRFDGQVRRARRLSGFCLALPRKAYEAVGPLDERFVWGEEDEDYCLRLRLKGFKLLVARDAFVFHEGGGTRGAWTASRRAEVDRRNRGLYRLKWGGVPARFSRDVRAVVRGA